MITRTFKLCLNAGTGSAPFINVSQTDRDETWLFELYTETGERYIPSSGAIIGIKSDGHGIANTGTVDSEGRVVITETEQMTASAGRAIFELSIDGLTHGTANFIVNVEKKPIDGAIMSDSDLSLISQAVDSAATIEDLIEGHDPDEVIADAVDAWLDAHPEATTTVLDGAITAPKLNQSLWDKLLVNEEASGAVASFDDGADDVPVSSLKVALEPIQTGSGDPSPTNIRPISGHSSVTVERTGKNLLPNQNVIKSGNNYFLCATSTDFPIHLKAGTYTIQNKGVASYCYGMKQGGSSFTIHNGTTHTGTFTVTEEGNYKFWYYQANVDETQFYDNMLEVGTETTEYEPYVGTSYPVSLGREVYGGTVDLATGVLTVTHKYVTLGDYNWTKNNVSFYTTHINDFEHQTTGTTQYATYYLSDCYSSINGVFEDYSAALALYYNTSYSGYRCFIHDANAEEMTAAEFKTRLQTIGAHLCYKLATPQTIQLTQQEVKTLLGYNNISSTGTVDVIYHADTKLYVDKMTNVDNAIIAPTEADFVATRNYTVNDLVIVADTLYKVTANIASGSAITPNSNVQQTTLGALIKALS